MEFAAHGRAEREADHRRRFVKAHDAAAQRIRPGRLRRQESQRSWRRCRGRHALQDAHQHKDRDQHGQPHELSGDAAEDGAKNHERLAANSIGPSAKQRRADQLRRIERDGNQRRHAGRDVRFITAFDAERDEHQQARRVGRAAQNKGATQRQTETGDVRLGRAIEDDRIERRLAQDCLDARFGVYFAGSLHPRLIACWRSCLRLAHFKHGSLGWSGSGSGEQCRRPEATAREC